MTAHAVAIKVADLAPPDSAVEAQCGPCPATQAMDRYANGDDEAFAALYDALAPRLFGFLLRKTADRQLAEDLVQTTMLDIHLARGSYVTGADVLPWVYAIARRLAVDAYRRRRREVLHDTDDLRGDSHFSAEAMLPDECVQQAQASRRLEVIFEQLPAVQQATFELVKQDGLSLAQAAQVLGTTIGAVKLRLHRACATLRAALTTDPVAKPRTQGP